ncbi:MAG TPA: YetF domain-containing protein [bacterium]|nr:YetF domain-containing protein [bacterium]
MGHLWIPDIPVWEKVLRSAVVYLFLLAAFRFAGKRQVGQLTPFDLVVLLILSNVVQNAVIGNDDSLGGGLLGAVVILALNYGVVLLTFRYRPFRRLMAGEPSLLVHNGRVFHDRLGREHLTMEDLTAALRKSGVADLAQVRFAILEDNGQISVIPREAPKAPPGS